MKLSTVIVLAGFALVAFRCAVAQQTGEEIVIEVNDTLSQLSAAADHYVGGYHSSVDGETIHYHSPNPDADSALLVRGQNVAPSISWETDPMPDVHSDFTQFIWLAGIECAGFTGEVESHNFAFLINGQRLTAFSKPIYGREHVSKLLLTVVPKFQQSIPDFHRELTFANGLPSILSWSGDSPVSLTILEPDGDRIRNIYVQSNPDKLKHFKK